jgi:hypothetical protein
MLAFSSARMKRHFHSKPERMSLERVTRSPVIAKETLEAERGKHGQDRTRVPNGAIGNRRATIAARCTRQEHSGEPPSRARPELVNNRRTLFCPAGGAVESTGFDGYRPGRVSQYAGAP